MLSKQIDILTIGDLATDAFIRLKDPHITCRIDHDQKELCMPFGDKIPFEYVKVVKGAGNSGNAAVAAARLGLRTAILANVGNDQNGTDCLLELQNNKVNTSFVKVHKNKLTNYHFVLWFGVDRTILINHAGFDYSLPEMFNKNSISRKYLSNGLPPKWIYLSSLAPNSLPYHEEIADYLEANPSVKLAFQPGTFQIKLGHFYLKRIFERSEIVIVNLEEAQKLVKGDSNTDIKSLLRSLAGFGPKLVAITDSINGAYLYDHDHFYHMPIYPDPRPPLERTGCGDSWATTFVSALALNMTPLEALTWAPVNSMSVSQFVGSLEGLLTRPEIEWWVNRAPEEYRPKEI